MREIKKDNQEAPLIFTKINIIILCFILVILCNCSTYDTIIILYDTKTKKIDSTTIKKFKNRIYEGSLSKNSDLFISNYSKLIWNIDKNTIFNFDSLTTFNYQYDCKLINNFLFIDKFKGFDIIDLNEKKYFGEINCSLWGVSTLSFDDEYIIINDYTNLPSWSYKGEIRFFDVKNCKELFSIKDINENLINGSCKKLSRDKDYILAPNGNIYNIITKSLIKKIRIDPEVKFNSDKLKLVKVSLETINKKIELIYIKYSYIYDNPLIFYYKTIDFESGITLDSITFKIEDFKQDYKKLQLGFSITSENLKFLALQENNEIEIWDIKKGLIISTIDLDSIIDRKNYSNQNMFYKIKFLNNEANKFVLIIHNK